jgi:hypothetical protein
MIIYKKRQNQPISTKNQLKTALKFLQYATCPACLVVASAKTGAKTEA